MAFVIACLVKNRAWILPDFLDALTRLQLPERPTYVFLDDCSEDDSLPQLADFVSTHGGWLLTHDVPFDRNTSSRDAKDRKALYAHLAALRNRVLDTCADLGADHVLSVDSDILVHPQLVEHLARHQVSYCSTLINNRKTITTADLSLAEWRDPCNLMAGGPADFRHVKPVPLHTMVRGTLSGACMLLRGEALAARFASHPQGEDGGHCAQLAAMNLPIYCDTTPLVVHVLKPGDLALARQSYAALCSR